MIRLSFARLWTTPLLAALLTCCASMPENQKPKAVAASHAISDDRPLSIQFSADGSTDSDGTIASYKWTFGDGQSASEKSPQHNYAKGGNYNGTLVVTDDRGGTASTDFVVNIVSTSAYKDMDASGGVVGIDGVINLNFTSGSFSSGTSITVFTSARANTFDDFDTTGAKFGDSLRATNEIRVNTGKALPLKAMTGTVKVPAELSARLKEGDEPRLFVEFFQDNDQEALDGFEPIKTTYDATTDSLQFTVAPEYFTDLRTSDATYEAILVVGSTPTKAPQSSASASSVPEARAGPEVGVTQSPLATRRFNVLSGQQALEQRTSATDPCFGVRLQPPLASLKVTDAFGHNGHRGVDYQATDGTDVMAMSPGVVARVKYNLKDIPNPAKRTGLKKVGYGWYVVINHGTLNSTNATGLSWFTAYGHLLQGQIKVKVGDKIEAGQVIAKSDTSGAVTGPHLHVDYVTGKGFDGGVHHDANACMGNDIKGSISVFDNGNIADDAFALSVNGVEVCRTSIGARNTCPISGLKEATIVTLTITVLTAPDNVGTYQIDLSDGFRFSDGSITVTGSPPQGASDTYRVVIPVAESP